MIIRKLKITREWKTHIIYWLIIANLALYTIATILWLGFYKDITGDFKPVENISPPIRTEQAQVSIISKPTIKFSGLNYQPTLGQMAAATRVCEQHGFNEEFCRNDLLAIAYAESGFNCSAIGGLNEIGCFQIMPFHNAENPQDFEWAANWTLERLQRYGYPEYRTHAIQCHNGCYAQNGYVENVKYYSTLFN